MMRPRHEAPDSLKQPAADNDPLRRMGLLQTARIIAIPAISMGKASNVVGTIATFVHRGVDRVPVVGIETFE